MLFFLSFWALCVFYLFCIKFNISFINFLTLHNHCLHYSRSQVLCVFVLTYLKQFIKTDTRHKNLTIALKKHASTELLRIKNSIYKGKCGIFTNWTRDAMRCKNCNDLLHLTSPWKFYYFRRNIYNPVKHLWWSFYCKNSMLLSIFTKKAPS